MRAARRGVNRWRARAALMAMGIMCVAGSCVSQESIEYGPPDDWDGAGDRWWRAGIDTTGRFPDLDTFDSMGLPARTIVFGAGRVTLEQQVVSAVRRRLLPLYRNAPTVVDSLFRRHVEERLVARIRYDQEPEGQIDRLVEDAYRTLARHFREPRPASTIGEDIPLLPRPDSLDALSGSVRLQVSIDTEGRSTTIHLLEGVHPILDTIAMQAVAQMQWSPAYLHGEPIAAWTRFRLAFNPASPR